MDINKIKLPFVGTNPGQCEVNVQPSTRYGFGKPVELPLEVSYTEEAIGRKDIVTYLDRLEKGSRVGLPKFLPYSGKAEEAMAAWKGFINKATYKPEIKEFDVSFFSKTGPQGVVPGIHSKECQDALQKYFEPCGFDQVFIHTLEKFAITLSAELSSKFGQTVPLTAKEALQRVFDRGMATRTGAPEFGHKDDMQSAQLAYLQAKELEENGCHGQPYYEYILGYRSSKQGLRAIFMEAFRETLIASMFTAPCLTYLVKTCKNEFTGWTDMRTGVARAYNKFRKENNQQWPKAMHFMSDFSKMDTKVRKVTSGIVINFIKGIMVVSDIQVELLTWSINSMFDAPLRVDKTTVLTEIDHGAFSGCSWIQLYETILQYVLYCYFLRNTCEVISDGGMLSQPLASGKHFLNMIGDDARLTFFPINTWNFKDGLKVSFALLGLNVSSHSRGILDYEEDATIEIQGVTACQGILAGSIAHVWSKLTSLIGLVSSVEKSRVSFHSSDFCKHLTCTKSKAVLISPDLDASEIGNYRLEVVYSTVLVLNSCLSPERIGKDWNAEKDMLRLVQILDGCVDHPHFENVVAYVADGHITDFFRRPAQDRPMYSIQEFEAIIQKIVTLGEETDPREYTWWTETGYKRVDLKDSPTVRYLRKTVAQWNATHPNVQRELQLPKGVAVTADAPVAKTKMQQFMQDLAKRIKEE